MTVLEASGLYGPLPMAGHNLPDCVLGPPIDYS